MAYFDPFEKINDKTDLSVRVTISQSGLENYVNSILPEVLFQTEELGGKKLFITAKKSGKVTFVFSGYSVEYQVQLDLEIVKKLAIGDLTASGLIVLYFKTGFDISNEWELKSTTEFQKYDWIIAPRFKAGFMNFPIEGVADLLIRQATESLVQNIDNQIVNRLDLKGRINWGTQKLSNLNVLENPNISFYSKIRKINISPVLSDREGKINGEIGAELLPFIFIGDRQEVYTKKPQIPIFEKSESPENFSMLTLPLFITFPELEKNIRARIVGESFSSGSNKAKIEDLKIYKKYRAIVIDAELSGGFEGRFLLSAEPRFDKYFNYIVLENLTFDLKTDNFLMKSVGWIFKNALKKRIRENVEEYLKRLDTELLKIARNGIEKISTSKGINLKIDLEKIEIKDLELEDAGINILSKAKGNLSLNLNPNQF